MITIDQLLESVDLDFEPRFVTKGKLGEIWLWADKPHINHGDTFWSNTTQENKQMGACRLKLSEFDGKDWTECIYEVPRKTTGKIKKIDLPDKVYIDSLADVCLVCNKIIKKQNEFVDVVNALIESNNIHEKQIDKLQMKLEPEKCAVNELKGAKNE